MRWLIAGGCPTERCNESGLKPTKAVVGPNPTERIVTALLEADRSAVHKQVYNNPICRLAPPPSESMN